MGDWIDSSPIDDSFERLLRVSQEFQLTKLLIPHKTLAHYISTSSLISLFATFRLLQPMYVKTLSEKKEEKPQPTATAAGKMHKMLKTF